MTDKEDAFFSTILNQKLEDSPVPEDEDLPIPAELVADLAPKTEEPVAEVLPAVISPVVVPTTISEKATQEVDYASKNLHSIIDQGKEALTHLLAIAKASQHPRAYEVVSELIKSVTDSNNQLIKIHQAAQEIEKNSGMPSGGKKVENIENQNNIFVGSTAELFEIIKKTKK